MKCSLLMVVSAFALLAGCASYRVTAPIHPPAGDPRNPALIDGRQPEFRWQAQAGDDVTYDLVVLRATAFSSGPRADCAPLEAAESGNGSRSSRSADWPSFEPPVYFRQQISEPRHRLDVDLEPGRTYLWSVRTRTGDKVSGWACYDYRSARLPSSSDVSVERVGLGLRVSFPVTALFSKDRDSFFVFRTAGR